MFQLELTAAVSSNTEFERKLADREGELSYVRIELARLQDVHKYLNEEHKETKRTLDETRFKLVAAEESCHNAEDDVKKKT